MNSSKLYMYERLSLPMNGRQRRKRRLSPRLEALKGRVVMSTLTVTNSADSGAGTLRAELAAANSGDTIVFAPDLTGTRSISRPANW